MPGRIATAATSPDRRSHFDFADFPDRVAREGTGTPIAFSENNQTPCNSIPEFSEWVAGAAHHRVSKNNSTSWHPLGSGRDGTHHPENKHTPWQNGERRVETKQAIRKTNTTPCHATMTSKRDLEQRLDGLREGEDDEDDEADAGDSLDIEVNRYLVISRERAEREDREILDVVDTPDETEHVKVEP